MIDARQLLAELKPLLKELEDDLRERAVESAELDARLRDEYRKAKQANRTAQAFDAWRDETLTQAAVAWILGCVFVRFMEDNGLVETPHLAGPGDRLGLARDHHTVYFQRHPEETDREYLRDVFGHVARLPAARELFDERHNPLWAFGLSGDGATRLLGFWQRIEPETGDLVHDFTDPGWNTRFLGDLYQDLSETARKRYALLQTPEFVEEFILDRTLTPAIEELGYREVRLIDPTCGSGHFLLGAFHRLFDLWSRDEPGTNPRELAQRALDGVHGVDLNPFAVAIARFRLLVAALRACNVARLEDAPGFRIHLAAGDSLLHGKRWLRGMSQEAGAGAQITLEPSADRLQHVYATEDREDLDRILGQQYHAVVGNPPYITVKDKALNQAYRGRYGACHMKYSLAVPFTERFFDLAVAAGDGRPAGFVGIITANSFMKREFGKKLIEEHLPRLDLTHVLDTSGAYIPGHGTPTVLLFGRNRRPVGDAVRTVMGIRGEPATPDDPAQGLVWTAILEQVDTPGTQGEFVSAADVPRSRFAAHPWSLGGGGAAELKERIERAADTVLKLCVEGIGVGVVTLEDEAFAAPGRVHARHGIVADALRGFVEGEAIRDWRIDTDVQAIFPYAGPTLDRATSPAARKCLWPLRTNLNQRQWFRKSQEQRGLAWWEYGHISREKFHTPLSIAFAFVATHNHFALDRGGKVFKQTAPVIKLPEGTTEDDHLALLALLNSSTACFWLKQVCQSRGDSTDSQGARVSGVDRWVDTYEVPAGLLGELPLPSAPLGDLSRRLCEFGERSQLLARDVSSGVGSVAAATEQTEDSRAEALMVGRAMVALQEDLDWRCYRFYGLVDPAQRLTVTEPPPIQLGERAFEIVMARKMAAGELETAWFERHGSTPITEIPGHWPAEYRAVVQRRIDLIESDPNIALIEQPEHKRRWNTEPWEKQQERALRDWLLSRLEERRYWSALELTTCARLADEARKDADFMQVAQLYRERADFDLLALVGELVESEAVPFLPVLRYKPTGLRKREAWERTWDLQRQEDAIDARIPLPEDDPVQKKAAEKQRAKAKAQEVGEIPVPPKYRSADFLKGDYWRLRGKLDVPKERFVSYPHCERDADPTLVVGWAGWDHLQQAQALAAYYVSMKDHEGWDPEHLTPLLLGLLELLPWLKQWYDDVDPTYGEGMGTHFQAFIDEESRALGLTEEQIRAWTPPQRKARGRRRKG